MPTTSTFIVECDEATWRALGFEEMSQADSDRRLRDAVRAAISTASA